MKVLRAIAAMLALIALVSVAPQAMAQYPQRPVRLAVGFAAGGPTDLVARIIAQGLEGRWGQAVVVDNRPGASGNIAAAIVAKAKPDGYTLLLGTTTVFSINPAIGRKTEFNPETDFVAVGLIGFVPSFVVVNAALPIQSMSDLVNYGKNNPGKLSYSTVGPGTLSHICSALIAATTGIDVVNVAYRGSAPSALDLVSGRVSFTCDALSAYKGFVSSGDLRVLAVSTAKRSPLLPDAPGMEESSFANFDLFTWYTIMAPASTPKAVVEHIGRDLASVVVSPDVRKKLAESGIDARAGMPEEVSRLIKTEVSRWTDAVRRSGAKVD